MSREVAMQNDQYFRALIEQSSDAVALFNAEGIVTYASPSSERVTGYTPELLIGMNAFLLLHPGDLENVQSQIVALPPGNFITLEYRVRHKNGAWRWMEGTVTNLLLDPLIQAIVINFRDTTERKQEEEERRRLLAREQAARAEAEARAAELAATFEAITDGMAICDASGAIRYTNPAYRRLFSQKQATVPFEFQFDRHFAWLDLRDMQGRYLSEERFAELWRGKGGSVVVLDALYRDHNGKDCILHINGAPIRGAAGDITGGVMVFRDVTGQRELERQLRYSEQKLRSLVQSNILGVAVSDSSGRIHEVNQRFAQLVGYREDELLSGVITTDHLVPREYREAMAQHEKTLITTGAMPPWETECLRKDGSRVPTLIAGALLDRERGLALVLFHDISDRKELERRKREFLSMVSHEMRTPLTIIMGLTEITLFQIAQMYEVLPPEAEPFIHQVERMLNLANAQVEVETRMVDDLLDASRLETHQFDLSLQPANLIRIVQDVVTGQQQVAPSRRVELVLPEIEAVPVLVDAGRIGQALTNYLTNALKYSPVDQTIAVCLEVVGDYARVLVSDLGPGLTREQRERVWERFYQVEAPERNGSGGGLGLGLAITRAIIEQHAGQVGVDSTPGQGSTFWFTLHLAEDAFPEGLSL